MMTDYTARLLVRAMSIQAEIEGMKASNAVRAAEGHSLPMYGEDHFLSLAIALEEIALDIARGGS